MIDVTELGGGINERIERTLAAMRAGTEIIYQATLRDEPWIGHADFLRRIDGAPSALGDWRYEVGDTKLARSPKAKFLVQLPFYSDLVAKAQGVAPSTMHVVLGDGTERAFRAPSGSMAPNARNACSTLEKTTLATSAMYMYEGRPPLS